MHRVSHTHRAPPYAGPPARRALRAPHSVIRTYPKKSQHLRLAESQRLHFPAKPRRGLLRKLSPHRVDLRAILRHKPPAGALGYQESLALQLVQCPLHGIRIYGKYAGTEINIDGKDYLIMKQGDILAII